MKITDRLLSVLGVDRERRTPPPRYRAIADGLLVTCLLYTSPSPRD